MSWIMAHMLLLGSGLGLGGLGVLGFLFPAVSVPILTAVGQWFARRSLSEIILFVVVAILIFDHLALLDSHRQVRNDQTAIKAAATALTAANANLATSEANEAGLRKAISDQNAAIAEVTAKSAAQQKAATAAENAASQRANDAEAVAQRLRSGTRSSGLKSAPASNCEPSETLKTQWKD